MKLFSKNKKNILEDLEDLELIKVFTDEKNMEAMGILYKRYSHLVYGVCLKYLEDSEDASDAMMEIFELIIDKIERYEIKYFKSYLYMLAKNHCLMIIRSNKRDAKYIDNSLKHNKEDIMDFDSFLHHNNSDSENRDYVSLLNSAMEHLKPKQKECVKLFYIDNKSYIQIAKETGYDLKKVKSYIQNGKRNLKILITNNEN